MSKKANTVYGARVQRPSSEDFLGQELVRLENEQKQCAAQVERGWKLLTFLQQTKPVENSVAELIVDKLESFEGRGTLSDIAVCTFVEILSDNFTKETGK